MPIERHRTRRLLWVTATAAPLLMTGCSSAGSGPIAAAARPALPAAVTLQISPGDGAADVAPNAPVTVRAAGGRLSDVQVLDASGQPVAGSYDTARTVWTATANLLLGQRYTANAVGEGPTGQVKATASFRTLDVPAASQLHISSVAPLDGATVGVGHPLIVTLSRNAPDRRAVQDALQVDTQPAVAGAWYWIDDRTLDYRPEKFWPAGTKVTLRARLSGLDLGHGVWGTGERRSTFTVGRNLVINVNVKSRRMTVVRDGKTLRSFPVSTGKPGWETRNGIKVLTERVRGKVWTNEAIGAPEEYTLYSTYAIRMTNSGEFIHDATWNPTIGQANTSHGCVGLRLPDMEWIWANTIPGDPVVVTGSPRPYNDLGNRIADWNIDWKRWSAGNAAR